ncbi:MAG: hypothetical protein QGF59_29185, partial [Pirellulaceae bacterium]|nr:hypothetical protein [Pirellulaceae bacterium]
MPRIQGKQIADDTITVEQLAGNALAATADGRSKLQDGFFDNTTTVGAKFSAGSVGLDRLEEAVIQADGGQAFTADQSMGSNKITNLATPTADSDAATKAYVDSTAEGLDVKGSVYALSDSNLSLSGEQT